MLGRDLMAGTRRKMLAARDDLADKVSEISASKGFTLFQMLNNMLELSIKAHGIGTSLEETFDTYLTMKSVKEASFTLIPENLLYETAEVAFTKAKEKTSKIWFDSGAWIAQQYITRDIDDPFSKIGKDLKAFGWNIPEFTLDKTKDMISVRVLSPRFSEVYSHLFTYFLEGVVTTFGYSISHKEIGKGNIRIEAVKK
jgi:hypothetical protein